MSQGLRLEQRLGQQLVMTPQLQQAIRFLQMSNLELREAVAAEIEGNPLLRLDDGDDLAPAQPAPESSGLRSAAELIAESDPGSVMDAFDTGIENLFDTGPADGPDRPAAAPERLALPAGVRLGPAASGWDGLDFERHAARPPDLREHLVLQLGRMRTEPILAALARFLAGELDGHGYLRTDLGEIAGRLGAGAGRMEAALALLQSCEPTGVGARNLAECLALQLAERNRLDPAMQALLDNLGLLATGERRRLQAICGVDADDFAEMLAELRALDPHPGDRFAETSATPIVPDLFLRRAADGGWEVELNAQSLPRILEDRRYAARLAAVGDREARAFLAECRATAGWLRRSLDQRARSILKIASEIVRHQAGFFAEGVTGLRPLTLRMVADATGLHESTASRVTRNKFMATDRGTFALRFFLTNAVGDENTAAETVRHRIRALVAAEAPDAILSDDAIVGKLQSEGINVARRTIVKYRKMLGIPSSSERRAQQAAAGAR